MPIYTQWQGQCVVCWARRGPDGRVRGNRWDFVTGFRRQHLEPEPGESYRWAFFIHRRYTSDVAAKLRRRLFPRKTGSHPRWRRRRRPDDAYVTRYPAGPTHSPPPTSIGAVHLIRAPHPRDHGIREQGTVNDDPTYRERERFKIMNNLNCCDHGIILNYTIINIFLNYS